MQMWWIGIALRVTGSFVSSTGLVLMKYSHNSGELEKPLYRRWRWWIGFAVLFITGGFLDPTALMFCPLSLIAPLFGLTVVTNSLAAVLFLGEKIQRPQIWATVVLVIGTCTTSAFGSHENSDLHPPCSIQSMQENYLTTYNECSQ